MTTRKQMLQAAIDSNRLEIIHIENDEVGKADTLAELASVPIDAYSEAGHNRKEKYHRIARKQLHKLAQQLDLEGSEYDIRSNKAGVAVCGEITLHTDSLYVQVSQSCLGAGHEIMFRQCAGRDDYCGKRNHFTSAGRLDDPRDFYEGLKRAGVV